MQEATNLKNSGAELFALGTAVRFMGGRGERGGGKEWDYAFVEMK